MKISMDSAKLSDMDDQGLGLDELIYQIGSDMSYHCLLELDANRSNQ